MEDFTFEFRSEVTGKAEEDRLAACSELLELMSEEEELLKRKKRIEETCDSAREILDNASGEFSRITSIFNKVDLPLFILSLILHGAAAYVMKELRGMDDKEIAQKTKRIFNLQEEHSGRMNQDYYCSLQEIWANPVPFDAVQKAEKYKFLKILKGANHRFVTLGHDPILGLFFGTANIMTSTLTKSNFESWHISTDNKVDKITERASTIEIFRQISIRIENEGKDGWIALGSSLLKEITHLQTDLPSTMSLPIPVVPVFSPKLAQKLSIYGINTGTILQGYAATTIINNIINFTCAILHRLVMKEGDDERLFEARTKKIIMYSNMMATCSDLGYTLYLCCLGKLSALKKFNLGGYIVTLKTIINNTEVIGEIERQFILHEFEKRLNDDEYR